MATGNPILNQASKNQASAGAAQDSLAAVQESLRANTAKQVENIQQLEKGAQQSAIATATVSDSVRAIATADQIVSMATQTAGLQAQEATINAYGSAGGIEVQTNLMAQLQEDSSRVQNLLNEKQAIVDTEHTGIGLVDGVINAFSSFSIDQQIQAAQAQRTQTVSDISAITASTESISQAQLVTRKNITSATIQANYEKLAAQGNLEAAKAEIANIGVNATAAARVMTANQGLTDNLVSVYKLENEVENRAVAKEELAFKREQIINTRKQWADGIESRAVALETAKLQLSTAKATNPSGIPAAIARNEQAVKDIQEQERLEAEIIRTGQAGQSLAGMTIEEPEMIIRGLTSTNPTTRAKYEKILELGSAAAPVMGTSPAEAFINYRTVSPSGNLPNTRANRVLTAVERSQADAFAKSPATMPKKAEGVQADFDARAQDFMRTSAAEIKTGDASNPYVGAPFSVLAESNAVRQSPLYKKVLAAKGMQELNPTSIIEASIAGMLAGNVNPSEAAKGISTIFKVAANINNTESGGFRRAGLPSQTSYNVQVPRESTQFEALTSTGSVLFNTPGLAAYSILDAVEGTTKAKDRIEYLTAKYGVLDLMDETAVRLHLVKAMSASGKTIKDTSTTQP